MIRDNYGNPVPRSEWDTSDYERAADRYEQRIADLEAQVNELANVLMYEFEDAFTTTDGSEGAVQMAIRVLREQKAVIDGFQKSP